MSAAVDNGCIQDSYTLYHHAMTISESGTWCVVQQGMNDSTARRYHWRSDTVESFVTEPQAAIYAQEHQPDPLDPTAEESAETRAVSVDLIRDDPAHLKRNLQGQRSLSDLGGGTSDDTRTGASGLGRNRSSANATTDRSNTCAHYSRGRNSTAKPNSVPCSDSPNSGNPSSETDR